MPATWQVCWAECGRRTAPRAPALDETGGLVFWQADLVVAVHREPVAQICRAKRLWLALQVWRAAQLLPVAKVLLVGRLWVAVWVEFY